MGCQQGYIVGAVGGESRPLEYSLEKTTGLSSEERLPVKKNENERQAERCSARAWSQEGPTHPSGWGNCGAVKKGGNRARDSRQGGVTKSPVWNKQKGLAFALKDTKKWEAAEIL